MLGYTNAHSLVSLARVINCATINATFLTRELVIKNNFAMLTSGCPLNVLCILIRFVYTCILLTVLVILSKHLKFKRYTAKFVIL